MFKPKGHHVRRSQVEKFTRYSIRKVSFGAASVAVATGLFFLGGGSVQAAEPVTNPESTEVQNPQNVNEKSPEPSKEVAGQASAIDKASDGQKTSSVKESTTDKQNSEVKTPNVVTEKVAINTASLEDLVAKVENRLSQLTEGKKTKSVIDDAKNLVNKAKELLNDDTKTQTKVDALAKQLSSSLVILNSIKSEATEEKETKNQDSRNGKAIPGKGESGFRAVDTTVDTTAANAATEAEKYKGIRDAAIPQLQANIAKIQAEIEKEEAKSANKKDQAKIDVLNRIKQKAEDVISTANAADTTSAKIMSQQAEAVKSERDLLALYLAGKTELGAPVSENHAAYGNNPTNGVFESLKEGFGNRVTFTDAVTKSETIAKQQRGTGEINAYTAGIGSATYNWKEKAITKADAEAGVLNGWKIEVGEQVNAVQPLDVTNVTDKDGAPSTRTVPKSKIYTNNGELKRFYTEGAQLSYNNGSGIIPTLTPTIDAMKSNAFGEVRNRDYYLELGSKGTTISKEYDVNGNSRINVNLIHGGAYGHVSTTGTGEKVKLKIVDAFTGEVINPVEGKNGPLATEQGPGGGNGWSYMARLYDIPATTTKIKVLIEAGDQAGSQNGGTENQTRWGNTVTLRDGYLIGGIGIATAPAAEVVTNVSSGRQNNEYGYTPDTIYEKNQKGSLNMTFKNTGGMNIDYYAASQVQVTIKVPKGVVLEDRVINKNGGADFLGNVYANTIKWVPNDPTDNSKGGTLTYNVPAGSRMAAAEKTTRSSSIVFTTANNFIGPADFKVTVNSGFGDTDAEGNKLYSYTINGTQPAYVNQFNRNGLANSDNPNFEYGKVIFINSLQANSVVTVPINTTNDELKNVAYTKAQEEVNSANFQQLLQNMNATAGLGQATNITITSKDKIEITKVAADGRGVAKVPVTYTADGRTYGTTVDIEVNVVKSTTNKLVVFEGDEITVDQVKNSIEPAIIDTKVGVVNNPNEADVFSTAGKAGQADLKIPTTVTHNSNGTNITETVEVLVTVLPKPTGNVEVIKGSTVDKVKEVAKEKASALVEAADFKGKLPTGSTVTVGDITEAVAETLTSEKGTNKGIVEVPATYTVDGKTYNTTIPVTINVLGSETKPVYTVEGTKPDAEKVKNAVTPGNGGTANVPTESALPETTGKVGAKDVTVPTTVTYPTGDETVNVPVEVLPKATPEKVTTLKDTTSDNLTTAVKEKAQAALGKLTLPSGVTVELDPNQNYAVPATDSNGDKDNVPVKVQYKDATGTVVAEDTISVPVTVVSSTPSKIVVFEGDEVTADAAKGAVTPGTDGTKGEPTTLPETAGKAGATDVKVDVPVTYDNGKLIETVSVPVTVLPKPEADEILVAKNSDKDKAKEKVLAKAKKAIEDATFKGKLPQGATVTVDETATITVPDLTEDTEVDVTVKYTVDNQEKTTTVKVPVTVVEGVPQIVPVKENNDVLPDPEKSIDKTDYPEGATFRYKTPEGQTTPIDVTTPGDKDVIVEVLDKNGNPIAEVPATVRVVESYPKYVPVDPTKKQPDPKENVNPNDFPTGTTFEYKDNTPVDTTTPGEKPVTVVAMLNGQPITEIPATIVVVEPKTQYVPVNAENDKKPKPQDSITPYDYPEGSTFEYKTPEGQTTPIDVTTPGEKDVTVVVKDPDGDTIVEVPAKIKVVQGKEQQIPVNAEGENKPKPEDSITPSDYPEGLTFEYKVPEGQTTPYDGTTPGDKLVTVVVKDKNGNVLVEVPATIKVVESKPTPIETPVTNTPLTKDDYTKGIKIPDGGEITKVENIPDLTTPGKKDPVKVTITLPNGKSYTVDVPVTVTPVKEIETPVTTTPLTQEDYTKGITIPKGGKVTKVENIPDLTTPGKKDPVKVTVTLPNGKVVTVEVPVNVTPITPIETPVTKDKLTPEDILKQIKVPEGATTKVENIPDLTTPGKKDPVKVTVTLPNGKVVTVEVPVNVTPIEDIVKKQGDPITAEDVENHIPTGAKVISIGDKPTTDVPGERPSVPVVIELPNGIRVTMNIPVIVTPKVTPVVVPVGTPVTPEDVKKHIELPKGWTVTKVGEIPTTTTPGTKPVVSVEIQLPDGRKITVDVPVIVTPTVRQIVVPQGTPITPDDVKGHIDLPKEPGWEIVEVGEIPTTIPAGVKPSVKVKVKVPTGEIVEVEVPVIVTPKVTPIVVEVGTPITKEDVKKKVGLPEGWGIVEVGEIPTTETPGAKPVVKVKVKLPDGCIITVDVPVTVTPKSQNGGGVIAQNGGSTVQIVTEYLDENGNRITSDKEGKHNPIELKGYEFSHSTTDAKGNTLHHYKKVKNPINQEQPSSPETPTSPEKPVATPVQTSSTDSKQVAETTVSNDKKELPNTGTEDKAGLASLGLLGMLGAFGLVARKKKED